MLRERRSIGWIVAGGALLALSGGPLRASPLVNDDGASWRFATATEAQVPDTPIVAPSRDLPADEFRSERQEALRLALVAPKAASEDARAFYEGADYRSLWFGPAGDDAKAVALIEALESAAAHGLPVKRYRVQMLRAALAPARAGDEDALAAAEIALTAAFLRYARDVGSGVLEPRRVDRELHVFPDRPTEASLLARLSAASSASAFMASLAPQDPGYARAVAALEDLRSVSPDAWGDAVKTGGSIRLGESGPRVARIRERLIALGDHVREPTPTPALVPTSESTSSDDPAAAFDPEVYDEALEASVRAFQERHGLNDDGVIGRRTIEAMNGTIDDRIGQMIVTLERMRWLNRDLGARHIFVNQADFTVQLKDRDAVVFSERVVVGQARKHRTPEFSDEMTYLVFNPTWNIPRSIATEEVLPKLQEDPFYLQKKNMSLVSSDGAPDPTLVDWSLYTAADFPYRIKQRPGDGNALGKVKFMFPNQFSIYLHDTPSKRLFRKDARAFSHGCVRVQDPMTLAKALLALQSDDPSAFITRILDRGKERRVNLEEPVPVHLTYRTAWVDEEGRLQFRADVYGRDARLLNALTAIGVEPNPGA